MVRDGGDRLEGWDLKELDCIGKRAEWRSRVLDRVRMI